MAGAKELVGLNKQRRVTVAGDAGDDAHLERVVEIDHSLSELQHSLEGAE